MPSTPPALGEGGALELTRGRNLRWAWSAVQLAEDGRHQRFTRARADRRHRHLQSQGGPDRRRRIRARRNAVLHREAKAPEETANPPQQRACDRCTPVTRVEWRYVRRDATSTETGVQFSRIRTRVQQVVVRHM